MSVITISRGSYSGGKRLAIRLAEKLGYNCISREDLSDKATKAGVPVGKLQMAMLKPPRVYKRMGRERDQYLACMTMLLCENIMHGDLVYHGHTGHLLLPGIPNTLRIRVLANMEYRIKSVIEQLNLQREKAKKYINNVDTDRDKWVRFLYGVDWHNPFHYDLVINLDQTGIDNAATALCSMAELPDFKLSPASIKAIKNLYLSSKAHFTLTTDPRTSFANIKVTANEGIVQVNYLPQQSEVAPYVQEVLSVIPEIKEVHTTIAQSTVLVIQEKYQPDLLHFPNIINLAKKWDAAVELMRMTDVEKGSESEYSSEIVQENQPLVMTKQKYDGGIMDDESREIKLDAGLSGCLDRLQEFGCSGGSSTFFGDAEALLSALQGRTNYSMIVIGDLFSEKSVAARRSLKTEMKSLLTDNLSVPVVGAEELQEQFKFGAKQAAKLIAAFIGSLILFTGLFTHQNELLNFLMGEEYKSMRILAVLLIVILTPAFAYTYGTFTGQVLKFFKLD